MLALLVGCLGVVATASEVERAGSPRFLEGARANRLVARPQPVTVVVPAPAGADSWISYTAASQDGRTALYVVTPEGSDLLQVQRDTPGSTSREWAKDGGSILYCSLPDYSAVALANQCLDEPSVSPHLRTGPSLTYLDSRPKRSPDGRTLAFVRIHDAESDRAALMTVDIIRGLSSEVVGFEANVGLGIDWSPDGRLLAYTSNPAGGPTSDLWVVAADGSQRRQITHLPNGWTASSPTFSPDGTRIAMSLDTGGWTEIAIAELAGSVPEAVVGFRNLVPQNLDWGPTVGTR
jgi:Tol biopolymer transport system component